MDKNLSKAIDNSEGQPPRPASYYDMLKHTWMVEEQRRNEPPTGHTEIGSSSTEHNEEIRMQNLHIDAEHDAEKLTNKYREEFTIAVSKLAVINLQIENIKGKITINSNQRSTLENVKAYIDSDSFTIEGFHKLTEDLTLEISKTDSDRQMDHSHDRATSSSDQSKRLGKRELKISDLRQLVWYYHYKLEDNEKQYAKLQENLTKAINDQKDFQNKCDETLIKLHKLDDLSPRDIPDQQIDDPQTRVNTLKKHMVEAIKKHEDFLEESSKLSQVKDFIKQKIKVEEEEKLKVQAPQANSKRFLSRNTTSEHDHKIAEMTKVLTELHAKQCEKSHKEEKEILDRIYQLTLDLTSAEQALAQFKNQRSTSPESQPSSSLEEAQPTQAEIKVWDLQISQYKHTSIIDYLHTKLIQHHTELNSLAKELQELPRPNQEDGTLHEQFQKTLSWRNNLLKNKHKLSLKIHDLQFHDAISKQIITSFSPSAQEIYDERSITLKASDLILGQKSNNNLQKINDGFKKEYKHFQKILENAKNVQKGLDEGNKNDEKAKNLKKELVKLIGSAEETLRMIEKNLQITNNIKDRAYKDLKNVCEGDLAEAQKQLDDIMAKMPPQDHSYFPWYRRNEYATENTSSYSTNLPGSCAVLTTMELMRTLGTDMTNVSDREVAKILRLDPKGRGSRILDIPKVLKTFNVKESYSIIALDTTEDLENILKVGKLPLITSITNEKGSNHAILVKGIREESGLKFVRILDPLYASKGCIAYEVLMEDFQKVRQRACAVPTKALNTWQYANAKCLEEVNNRLLYPQRPKFNY